MSLGLPLDSGTAWPVGVERSEADLATGPDKSGYYERRTANDERRTANDERRTTNGGGTGQVRLLRTVGAGDKAIARAADRQDVPRHLRIRLD